MKLMAVDGNSIVNRAFYGIRELTAPDGTPTNAVYGFLAILEHLYQEMHPEAVCVAFDRREPTFRHRSYDFYKAQRKPMPEELAVQMPILKELLDAMGVQRLELAGYEADDLLGTVSRLCEEQGDHCVIVTGDKDSLQLVSGSTSVCNVKTRMGRTESILYTPERFQEEYGFLPPLMVDLKALMGDSSDNIPGVAGIGEKTALDLIRSYGSIAELYAKLPELELRESVRKKLISGEQSAQSSYWLATSFREVPLEDFRPEDCIWTLHRTPELLAVMKRLGFRKMIEKWGLQNVESSEPVTAEAAEPSLRFREVDSAEELNALAEKTAGSTLVSICCPEGLGALELCLAEEPDLIYTLRYLTLGEEYERFCAHLFSPAVPKAGHNVKDLMNLLREQGYSLEGFTFDTALAGYLLRATDSDYALPLLSVRYLGRELDGAAAVAQLVPVLDAALKAAGMEMLFREIELPLCTVLSDMEETGFLVDRAALAAYGESLNAGIAQLQQEIWDLAGHEFNILSPNSSAQSCLRSSLFPPGRGQKPAGAPMWMCSKNYRPSIPSPERFWNTAPLPN